MSQNNDQSKLIDNLNIMQEYNYPTNETATDHLEGVLDSGKRIREIALISSMAAYEWKTCIDFGTGIGRNLSILYNANKGIQDKNILAYDIDKTRLSEAQKKVKRGEKITFLTGDIKQISKTIKDNSIDCILCCQVLGHTQTFVTRKIMDFFL